VRVALSDLLQSLRIARVDSAFVELGREGGVQFAGDREVFLYLALEGNLLLESLNGVVDLAPGDFAMVFAQRAHALKVAPHIPPTVSRYFSEEHTLDTPPTVRFGSGQAAARLLAGCFRPRTSHPLIRSLPREVVIRRADSPFWIGLSPAEVIRCARGAGASTFLTSLVDMLFMQAARSALEPLFSAEAESPTRLDSFRISIALNLIQGHPERQWSVASLAREINMSRSAFAAEFLTSVGEPPMRYLTRVRMQRAANLLGQPSIAVSDVAWQVGYQSLAAFVRAFKQHFGVTPRAYQRREESRHPEHVHSQTHWAPFVMDDM
jgi:AraC-like DNA-binding protein